MSAYSSEILRNAQLTVQNIDVEEGNESKTPLTGVLRDVPLLNSKNLANRVESNNLLEEVESGVASLGVREVGDACWTGPRDDGNEENADDDGTLDAVQHKHDGQDTTTEDTDPHSWAPHLYTSWTDTINLVSSNATGEFKRGRLSTGDETDTSGVGETNDREVESNTDTGSELDTSRNSSCKPLPNTEHSKANEDETFDEYSGKSDLIGDHA